jgi:DNA-binding transcriptional ArsR family regulator
MVNYATYSLDLVFGALSSPVRRQVLERLSRGAASIKELAAGHSISLPGLLKHVAVLEKAGLVETYKEGRVRTCRLNAAPMLDAVEWLAFYRAFWNSQLDALADYLEGEGGQ